MREIIEHADAHNLPRIKLPTVAKYISALLSAFNYAIERQERFDVERNPFRRAIDKSSVRKSSRVRRDFSDEEVFSFFENLDRLTEEDAWLARILAYTGARLEEIAGLRASDIRHHDGCWVIDLTNAESIKNEQSRRRIPIHSELIRASLIEWAESRKGQLWHFRRIAGRYGHQPGQRLNAYIREHVTQDPNATLHSLRHTVKSRLIKAFVPEPITDEITGHADGKVGRRYIHVDTATLSAAIERLGYPCCR